MPTVLIVDDEPMIRTLLEFIFRREGFEVLVAGNGCEAIKIYGSHRGHIDLLVSDITMPGMDGPTLAAQLVAANSRISVLLMSGSYECLPEHTDASFGFISKPFSISNIVLTVQRIMSGVGIEVPVERLQAKTMAAKVVT